MKFQKQYELLYKLPAIARAESPSEAEVKGINEIWWSVLNDARTIFESGN